MLRVLPPTFEPVWQQIRLQSFFFEGGNAIQFSRCATMLPKKLHVRFLLAVFPYLEDYLTFTSSQLESQWPLPIAKCWTVIVPKKR